MVVVTGLALRALLPVMLVVFLVAGVAIHRGVLIPIVGMAVFAGHFGVLVAELVAGFVVIKAALLPIAFGVTIRASVPRQALMLVVLLVAGVAV